MLLSGTYTKLKSLLENYMNDLSQKEKQKVFSENAIQFYNLNS
jgi:predicted TIM-barrel fold metal-dependent hydrolase